jgi:F0F1-type ATP synthase membrane subunit b/b'
MEVGVIVNINLTIIVQCINFLIAYLIIRLLLVKPSIQELESDKNELQQLSAALSEKNAALVAQEEERMRRWHMCQQTIAQQTPSVISPLVKVELSDMVKLPEISGNEIQKYAHDVQEIIVKRLSNVRI